MKRLPFAANQFYPGTETALRKEVKNLLAANDVSVKEKAVGVVSPHAGYIYSGKVAACVFSSIEIPDTIIILGPNHTGAGARFSIFKEGTWVTPLGDVEIDTELASLILKKCSFAQEDIKAHAYEHSLEVQLPFIQYLKKNFKIVPLVLAPYNLEAYQNLGESIASAVKELKRSALIVASSDMTHYEPRQIAEQKDKKAIFSILNLDAPELITIIEGLDISMCGYVPVAVMIFACKNLGAKDAKLVKYQTSGDVSGDYDSVVGYAGIIVK